jgi:PhnB protein
MPQLNPYLSFDGRCAEAMRFYATTLGGTLGPMFNHGETAPQRAGEPASGARVMHARLELPQGDVLMAGDSPAGMAHTPMAGIRLTLTYAEVAEARRVFAALSDGATVEQPMQATFWAETFGMLTDRFGTPWVVNGAMKAPQ